MSPSAAASPAVAPVSPLPALPRKQLSGFAARVVFGVLLGLAGVVVILSGGAFYMGIACLVAYQASQEYFGFLTSKVRLREHRRRRRPPAPTFRPGPPLPMVADYFCGRAPSAGPYSCARSSPAEGACRTGSSAFWFSSMGRLTAQGSGMHPETLVPPWEAGRPPRLNVVLLRGRASRRACGRPRRWPPR